jgi:DNA gyrase subunit A
MGRAARGVRGITLQDDDYVIGVAIVDDEKKLLTVTENGMGKRSSFDEFREMKHRGGKGVACHKLSEKSGKLAAIATVSDDDDVMMITDKGTIIRMSVSDINTYSRTAGGVIVMRTSDDNKIITLSRLEKIEELEEIAEAENEKISEENKNAETSAPEKERASLDEEESF